MWAWAGRTLKISTSLHQLLASQSLGDRIEDPGTACVSHVLDAAAGGDRLTQLLQTISQLLQHTRLKKSRAVSQCACRQHAAGILSRNRLGVTRMPASYLRSPDVTSGKQCRFRHAFPALTNVKSSCEVAIRRQHCDQPDEWRHDEGFLAGCVYTRTQSLKALLAKFCCIHQARHQTSGYLRSEQYALEEKLLRHLRRVDAGPCDSLLYLVLEGTRSGPLTQGRRSSSKAA